MFSKIRVLFWGVGRRGSIVALSFSWGEVLVKVNQRKKINTSSSVQFACFRVRIAPCLGYAYCTAPDQCRGATSPTSSSNPACRLARHVPLLQEPGAFVNGHVATWLPKGPLVLSFNPCQDRRENTEELTGAACGWGKIGMWVQQSGWRRACS